MKVRKLAVLAALVIAVAVPLWAQQEVSEEDYDAAMKSIRATMGGVNDQIEAEDAEAVGASGQKFVDAFTKAETFWKARNVEQAMEMSMQALAAARKFQEAGSAGNFAAASEAFGELRGTCMPCHMQYRERVEGGGYRIKQGY